MLDFEITQPTPEAPLLVGLLIDVSGSMMSSIANPGGPSQNRLQAFQDALEQLASKFQASADNEGINGLIGLFAYGFGFGNALSVIFGGGGPAVQDLLSGMRGANNPVELDHLARNWQVFRSHVEGQATKMFGSTPMVEGFRVVHDRFQSEESRRRYSGKLLFVLSDGDPTDGHSSDVLKIAEQCKSDNIGIISCFVTDGDITEKRTLYSSPGANWPEAASLMLGCSSVLPQNSSMESYLNEHKWSFSGDSKLFCQINQSDVLKEFIGLILSTVDEEPKAIKSTGKVFISYSHKDKEWLDKIRVHLKPLERDGRLSIWDDRDISVGGKWRDEIKSALDDSSIAILIVSPDFLASDFVIEAELPTILKSYEGRGTKIIPVLVRSSRYAYDPVLSEFQSFNPPSSPLNALQESEQEELLVRLSLAVEKAAASNS